MTSLVQVGIATAGQRAALEVLRAAVPRLQKEAEQTEREQAALRRQHDAVGAFEHQLVGRWTPLISSNELGG